MYLFKTDNFEHRASIRAKLANDPEWKGEYFGRVVPMFQNQDNLTLTSLSPMDNGADVHHPEGKGCLHCHFLGTTRAFER